MDFPKDFVAIRDGNISIEEIKKIIGDVSCGALAFFVGTTRDINEGKKVINLVYEAYAPMAEKVMREILSEVRQRWPPVNRTAMVHRIGEVPLGETSVIVGISSPHRGEAFAALEYAVDQLKARVPLWKQEFFEDGGETKSTWRENAECTWKRPITAPIDFSDKSSSLINSKTKSTVSVPNEGNNLLS